MNKKDFITLSFAIISLTVGITIGNRYALLGSNGSVRIVCLEEYYQTRQKGEIVNCLINLEKETRLLRLRQMGMDSEQHEALRLHESAISAAIDSISGARF